MYRVRDPDCVDGAVGVPAIVLDQLVNARAKALPLFSGRRCAADLNHEESDSHILLHRGGEPREVSLGGALPEQKPAARFIAHRYAMYRNIGSANRFAIAS